jgi:hypothetical protein
MPELDWPSGFNRTPPEEREPYPHNFKVTRAVAFESIRSEIEKIDVEEWRVETAAPHTQKHPYRPYEDRDPDDPGVVVYFVRDGDQHAVPCDRWDTLRDNARAIAKYLDAKRAIGRYGVETVDAEFATARLLSEEDDAEGADPPPHEVLEIPPDSPPEVVRGAYRAKAKQTHPDRGGSQKSFERVERAKEALIDG